MVSANTLYLIKDVSRLSGYSIHTLKFYLKRGLIHEVGRSPQTRFRYFDDATVARLAQIRTFRKQRKRLSEIQQLLCPSPERPSPASSQSSQEEGSPLSGRTSNYTEASIPHPASRIPHPS